MQTKSFLRKSWDLPKGHPKAHQHLIIVSGKNVINDHEPKITLLLAKARGEFLNCHLIKKSRDTKPAYKYMVIIPLWAIELKTTPRCVARKIIR